MFAFPSSARPYVVGKPPLARAVTHVVFPFSAHLITIQGLADLQDRLADTFLLKAPLESAFQISVGIGAPPGQRYVFAHARGYELAITATTLTLSINEAYESRDAFQTVLENALNAIGDVGKIKEFERLGVRYINAAPASIEEFLEWFKPEFTGWAGRDLAVPDAQRTWILVTQINRSDPGAAVTAGTIRYGYLPSGVGNDITSSDAATMPSFLADIDMASFHGGQFSSPVIGNLFREINHEIAAFFEYSLSDNGVKHFELKPKEDGL